jgi:hypothetical protein
VLCAKPQLSKVYLSDRDRGARLLSLGSSIHQFEQFLAEVDILGALLPFGNLIELSGAINNGRSRSFSSRVYRAVQCRRREWLREEEPHRSSVKASLP